MTPRTERKYSLTAQQLHRTLQRLKSSLPLDPHCANGPYHIRSIYFDGPKWPAVWEKVSGTSPRRKYRIRFYNRRFDRPQLECKRKVGEQIIKESRAISPRVCRDLLNQRRTKLSNVSLMRQFQVDQRTNGLKPHLTVDYFRTAFVHDLGQLRITLDTDLATGRWQDWNSIQHMPVRVIEHPYILELKYTALHPNFIQMLLPNLTPPQLAISKYVLSHSQLASPLKGH